MSCRFPRGECSPPLAAFTPSVSLQCLSVYTEFLIASGEVQSGDLGKRESVPWFEEWLAWAEASWIGLSIVRSEAEEGAV